MSGKNRKQFGVWMDAHHATIVGRENIDSGEFTILGHVKNTEHTGNSNENAENNHEQTLTQRFFKEITSLMQNVDEIHVTGTGDSQEQFIKYLGQTPQYKNATTSHSTSVKMGDEKLIELIDSQFGS